MPATKFRNAQHALNQHNRQAPGGLVGDVAKFLLTRSLLTRVARVGGIQGMVLSAAATYALNRYLTKNNRR
jgi:hypothetical protein